MKKYIGLGIIALLVATLFGGYAGYSLRAKLFPNNQLAPTSVVPDVAGLIKKIASLTAQVEQTTAQSRAALDSLAYYRKQYKDLQKNEALAQREFEALARDSAASKEQAVHACSLVILDCQKRAQLADSVVQVLQARLDAQTGLQANLCNVGLGTGPSLVWADKKVQLVPIALTGGLVCKVPVSKIFKLF